MVFRWLVAAGLLGAGGLATAGTCEGLASLSLPDTTISTAAAVAAGSFAPPGVAAIPNLPAFCRVAGSIHPIADSDIRFEVWMPAADWNGKFAGADNGGFGGSIDYDKIADALRHGYAAASTDTGHQAGFLGPLDATWAPGHPEKVADFGSRAIHEMTAKGQAITAAYYGQPANHSYFNGCSNGGRQGLMEAERYPDDYDGIIAGDPAYRWTDLFTAAMWGDELLTATPASWLPSSKLPAIDAAELAACDGLDGVVDGVIDDPRKCNFDPATLLCAGAETDACLTAAQIDTLKHLYKGPQDASGTVLFPGYPMGGHSGPDGWQLWVTGTSPGTGAMNYFGWFFFTNMVYDASWNPATFDFQLDAAAADAAVGTALNATDANLTAFRQRGGKLILFHGWSDPAIPTAESIWYYNAATAGRAGVRGEPFVRLFLAPGMQHCQDGPGPESFGQNGFAGGDAGSDLETSLERWVEQGVAPERVVATKYVTPGDASSGVVRTRPLCAYPEVARWTGQGSTDDAANFTCEKPGVGRPGHGPIR